MQYFHWGFCKWNWQANLHRAGHIVSKCFTKADVIKMAKVIMNLYWKKKLHWIQIKKSQNHWDVFSNIYKDASFSLSSLKENWYIGPKVPVVLMFFIKIYVLFYITQWVCYSLFLLLRVLFIPKLTWQVPAYEKRGHFNCD